MLSVAIITYNEEERIQEVIESVRDIASEVIVVDSGSTDKTKEICKSMEVRFIHNEWKGFSDQKNFALSVIKNQWYLSLDADEVLTKELANEIQSIVKSDKKGSYFINRKTFYLGKLMKHMWQPDYQLRLAHIETEPSWSNDSVHEKLICKGKSQKLENHLIHYSYRDLNDHFEKMKKYARLGAEDLHRKGKKASVFNLMINPVFKFKKQYLLKGGFLDGVQGLVGSFSSLVYTYMKYSYLLELEKQKGNK